MGPTFPVWPAPITSSTQACISIYRYYFSSMLRDVAARCTSFKLGNLKPEVLDMINMPWAVVVGVIIGRLTGLMNLLVNLS